jgi:hypothetical protein
MWGRFRACVRPAGTVFFPMFRVAISVRRDVPEAVRVRTARPKVTTLLAAGTDALTAHDIASKAIWVDKYRPTRIPQR